MIIGVTNTALASGNYWKNRLKTASIKMHNVVATNIIIRCVI